VEAPEPRFVAPTNRDRIGRIWAPVMINGKGPFRLVLDTGASHSALIAHTVERLGILPEQAKPTRLYGVTGTAIVPSVDVDSMEAGDILIGAATLPIVADVFGGAEGVLGREGLSDKRILADFKHDRLVISFSHRESAPLGYTVIHLQLTKMGLLAIQTLVGDVPAKAIIDTGAQTTIGNLALRRALMRRPPVDTKEAEVVGVTLDVQKGDDIPAPPIRLEGLKVSGVNVTFGDMSLFDHWQLSNEPTVLIGMDVLGLVDVLIIDYKLHQLQVRMPHAGSPFPVGHLGQ
jgi:predicted aspartyl protease